jgi:DNA-binding transcriptional MerR regulator
VLGVDESTLRRWADSGYVRVFRTPGGHRRFAEPELQQLLAGRPAGGRRSRELGELTVNRIRRQLHKRSGEEASWYASVDETTRERLRELGRRLSRMAGDYLGRRSRRTGTLEGARELGCEYGQQLAASRLPLTEAVREFIFFRRNLDDTTRAESQRKGLSAGDALAVGQQVTSFADQVLLGLIEAYEELDGGPA